MDYTYLDIAKMIDHSLLNPTLTVAELEAGCKLALEYDTASVCILPYYLRRCAEILKESTVRASTTIGFPHGGHTTAIKVAEAKQALDEWSSFYLQARDEALVNRNILALADEFCRGAERSPEPGRHLFAAAITPRGIESKLDSLLDDSCAFYGVKGSPGSGVKELLSYTAGQLSLRGVYAEIYHNPLVPGDIDIIISPAQRLVMIDVSNSIFDYTSGLANVKFKRWLDFDHLANNSVLNANQGRTEDARQRIQQNLEAAVEYIAQAKETHDQLETHYVPALDFEQVDMYREALQSELRMCLT